MSDHLPGCSRGQDPDQICGCAGIYSEVDNPRKQLAAERARVERLVEALETIRDNSAHPGQDRELCQRVTLAAIADAKKK